MVFSHPFFVYFFEALLLLSFYVVHTNSARRAVLIAFSLVFYAWGEPLYVFLMIFTVLLDYLFGRLIGAYRKRGIRRLWLICAVTVNLGILCYFKYLGFFAETVNTVFRTTLSVPNLTMPIGISFFTFQALSYVIDVYRGDADVQYSFPRLLLYVSLFPQLIAGPIVRYKDIEQQLDDMHVSPGEINDGIFRFSVGLAKKLLIADTCASVVTSIYAVTDSISVTGRWAGAVFFALQIYFDFSGYSDMAIGLGHMVGFRFNENFRYPYAARTATDFWRRWHISLGTFFRDYVYIPLGGNRRRRLRNILVVWFLTGLWHGASWNFVIWGLFYGALLIFEKRFFIDFFDSLPRAASAIISRIYSVFITVFGFAIFYFTENTAKSIGYLFGIGVTGFSDIFTTSIVFDNLNLLILAVLLSYPIIPAITGALQKRFRISYGVRRGVMLVVSLVLVSLSTVRMIGNTYSPFLYWNF